MELEGKIIVVGNSRGGVSQRGTQWKVQEYVLETLEAYPKKLAFEVFGEDKIQQFNIQAGETIRVSFDIDAREWNGRWYNSVRAWKVDRVTAGQPATAPVPGAPQPAAQPAPFPPSNTGAVDFGTSGNSDDDLPF